MLPFRNCLFQGFLADGGEREEEGWITIPERRQAYFLVDATELNQDVKELFTQPSYETNGV